MDNLNEEQRQINLDFQIECILEVLSKHEYSMIGFLNDVIPTVAEVVRVYFNPKKASKDDEFLSERTYDILDIIMEIWVKINETENHHDLPS